MKKCLVWLLAALLLAGCGKKTASQAESLRQRYREMQAAQMEAEITCHLETEQRTYAVLCQWDRAGARTTVTGPEDLAGLTASVSGEELTVSYDGAALSAGSLRDLAPANCLPWLLRAMEEGYLVDAGQETLEGLDCLRLALDTTAPGGKVLCITVSAKEPEKLMHYMNFYWTEKGIELTNFGIEGVTFTRNEDGSRTLLPGYNTFAEARKVGISKDSSTMYWHPDSFIQLLFEGATLDTMDDVVEQSYLAYTTNSPYAYIALPGAVTNTPTNTEKSADIWTPLADMTNNVIMGLNTEDELRSLIAERFGWEVTIDSGRISYRETIAAPVEGVGHFEPLRHYAEVHLILAPLPQGSGLVFDTVCSEDVLDRNWQRLIMTRLQEKTHLGVLTGSAITDVKITLMSGRAHVKHTEGGDFRQATYRAVRQGLMQAKSRLLEPYYAFRLEVPPEQLGRAINDVRLRSGSFDTPEEAGDLTLLRGRVPVTEFDDYAQEVASYTGGRGRLSLEPAGYGPCHNPDAVIAAADYDPEADPDNTPDSVFCAHGGGFTVKWDKVPEYMHLPGCLEKPREDAPVRRRCIRLDDAELEAIMTREFGPVRRPLYRAPEKRESPADTGLREIGQRCYVVDGYNVIFDWDELHALADRDLPAARERLMDTLCGWAAFTHTRVVLVFDGYKVPGNTGEKFDYRGIHVVYTRERETGDMYIERFLQQVGKNDRVRVVTSDGLIQLSAVRTGAMRMSSAEFGRQVSEAAGQIAEILKTMHQSGGSTIGQRMESAGK